MYIGNDIANIGAVKHKTNFQQPCYPLHTLPPFCLMAYLFSTIDLATMLSNMPYTIMSKIRGIQNTTHILSHTLFI